MLYEFLGLTDNQFFAFFLALIRITALIAVAPVFGSPSVPAQLKVFFSFFLTIAILPMIKTQIDISSLSLSSLIPLTMKEVTIGLFLGFNAKFIFESFNFAGRIISNTMGLAMAELIDPESGSQATPIGNLFTLTALVLFLQLNGHHLVLSALYRTFELVPVAGTQLIAGAARMKMLTMFNELFIIGVKLAAPSLVILFLVEVSMGIMARIVPQMNIFFIGLPLRLGVGLYVLIISLPIFYVFFGSTLSVWKRDLWGLIKYF